MADVEMKARIEQYVNFRAKFGIIQNSFPEVDQTVTADSENPVSSKAVYEFTKDIEEDLDTRIDEVSDALNRKIADKPSRGEFKTVGGQSIFGEGDIPVGGGDGSVKDVTVNGASVLDEDGTAAITTSNMLGDGTISNRNVTEETNEVVMPLGDLDRLVKHAMCDGKGANWDETSKRNARSRLGVPSVSDLSAKQNKLTAGTNIKIENDEISAEPYDDTEIKEEISSLDGKIKELELFKFPNVTIIGTPIVNNGQISGFSATSFLKFPFLVDFRNQPFEINMCFTTGSNVVNQENIFDSDFGLAFAVRNARFVIAISTNGTTWDLGEGVGTLVVQPNTNYFVRLAWDKSSYSLSYSFDGESYTTDIVKTGTVQPYPKQIFVGVGENFATVVNSFSGIVNLNSCSLAVNGEIIWTGMDDAGLSTRADVSLSNIDADGEAKIKEVAETTTIKANLQLLPTDVKIKGTSILDDNKVANIPIATNAIFGVIKGSGYGINITTDGRLNMGVFSQDEYNRLPNTLGIGKATLENRLAPTEDRIDVLEKMSKGILYDFVTQTVEGTQSVPKGSHLADVQKLEGKSVVWNQLIENKAFTNSVVDTRSDFFMFVQCDEASEYYSPTQRVINSVGRQSISFTSTKNAKLWRIKHNGTAQDINVVMQDNIYFIANHKYYLTFNCLGVNPSVVEGLSIDNLMLFDLTQMFGDGNEPTIEQFEAMFPDDYYPYSEPTLQSVDNTKMIVKGNYWIQLEEGEVATDYAPYSETDYPLTFAGKSAGKVRDELDLVNKKYIQRIGVVDLGSLSWTYGEYAGASYYNSSAIENMKAINIGDTSNILTPNYQTIKSTGVTDLTNMTIFAWITKVLYLKNDNVSSRTELLQSLQGVMLYYELAEPIITDVSDVIDSFEVEGNGSIEFDSSIPVRNTIEYLRYLNEV